MTQPIRAYTCPYCGPSIVSLLPGKSWWDTCPNGRHYPGLSCKSRWGEGWYVCGTWIKHRKVGALVEGVAGVLGYVTEGQKV